MLDFKLDFAKTLQNTLLVHAIKGAFDQGAALSELCNNEDCGEVLALPEGDESFWFQCPNCGNIFHPEETDSDFVDYHFYNPDSPRMVGAPAPVEPVPQARSQGNINAPVLKAANFSARAGETIVGNLARGGDGKFTSGGGNVDDNTGQKLTAADITARLHAPKPKGGKGKKPAKGKAPPKPKKTPEEKAAELAKKKADNVAAVTSKISDDTIGEIFSLADDPLDPGPALNDEGKKYLVDNGLAKQHDDGSVELNGKGRTLVRAMQSGNLKRSEQILKSAKSGAADQSNARADRAQALRDKADKIASGKKKSIFDFNFFARKDMASYGHGPGGVFSGPGAAGGMYDSLILPGGGKRRRKYGKKKKALSTDQRDQAPKVFPDDNAFPIPSPDYVRRAVSSWGRYKGNHSFDEFKSKLTALAHKLGAAYVAELPAEWTKKEVSPTGGFKVTKDAQGKYRWLAITSSSYRDQDRQIVSKAALDQAVALADKLNHYGVLNWWHTGVVLGDCDYNAMHDNFLIESGTFRSKEIAEAFARVAPILGASIEFVHPISEPDSDGVFYNIIKGDRAVLPNFAASNLFTKFQVEKDHTIMHEEKMNALKSLFPPEIADKMVGAVLDQAVEAAKTAEFQGIAKKAAGDMAAAAGSDEGQPNDDAADEAAEEETYVGDMTKAALEDLIKEVMTQVMSGSATKETNEPAWVSTLKSSLVSEIKSAVSPLEARLKTAEKTVAELNSTQPRRASRSLDNITYKAVDDISQPGVNESERELDEIEKIANEFISSISGGQQ